MRLGGAVAVRASAEHSCAAATAVLATAVLTGCSAGESGAPQRADWSTASVYPALRSIPADEKALWDISLVDPGALNRLNQFADRPLPSTAVTSGGRPPAESTWTRASLSGSGCAFLDGLQRPQSAVRTGPPGPMLSVYFGKPSPAALLAVCAGDVDTARLGDVVGDDAAPTARSGVDGYGDDTIWVGHRDSLTYLVGSDVPAATADAVLTGTPVASGSLADDPGVQAVLAATPRAAVIEMGTVLTGMNRDGPGASKQLDALVADVETTTGKQLPAPIFGGYGWTPGADANGTGTFVTCYASVTEAADAAAVLTAVWPKAPDSAFATAVTAASDRVVRTDVPGVESNEFDLRTLRLLSYPGFHGAA